MKPYGWWSLGQWSHYVDNNNLSEDQRKFNKHLSRARVVVEDDYGRLRGRWHCLSKRNDTNVPDLPKQVAACCVLHTCSTGEIHGETLMKTGYKIQNHSVSTKYQIVSLWQLIHHLPCFPARPVPGKDTTSKSNSWYQIFLVSSSIHSTGDHIIVFSWPVP